MVEIAVAAPVIVIAVTATAVIIPVGIVIVARVRIVSTRVFLYNFIIGRSRTGIVCQARGILAISA